MIRKAKQKDVQAITDIYNYYVHNSIATFAKKQQSTKEFKTNLKNAILWLVYEKENQVIGYANASPWKERCAYKQTVQCSIYLKATNISNGIGSKLYAQLFSELRKMGYHTVISGISLPNEISERLHKKFGFEKVAHFKEVGFKFNKWIDVGYWQRILNP